MRLRIAIGAVSALVVVGLAVACTDSSNEPKSLIGTPSYVGSAERTEYQRTLNESKNRFETQYSVVEYDNQLWVRKDLHGVGFCEIRCGVILKDGDNYKVSLPVGYTHDSNVSPMPKDLVSISTLTYWNPDKHTTTQTTHKGTGSVALPFELDERDLGPYMERGKTGYVGAWLVRKDKQSGKYFLSAMADIRNEPLGREFGRTEDALITRRSDGTGFEVRLPEGYKAQVSDVEYGIPVQVTFAKGPLIAAPGNLKRD